MCILHLYTKQDTLLNDREGCLCFVLSKDIIFIQGRSGEAGILTNIKIRLTLS